MTPEGPVISVHVPKSAGTALRRAMIEVWGRQRILFDYDDRPLDPASAMHVDPDGFRERVAASLPTALAGKRIVHGHFNPWKYAGLAAGARWITFLRDPVRRTISHYYFWRERPRSGNNLHAYMLDQDLSVFEFARLPFIRRFYTDVFFGGVDLDTFDIVGLHETFDADLKRVERLLGTPLPVRADQNATTATVYRAEREALLADPKAMARLRDLLRDDLRFYDRFAGS
jgi:hypothetical protein